MGMKCEGVRNIFLDFLTAKKGTCCYDLDKEMVMVYENNQWMPACQKCACGCFVYWLPDQMKYSDCLYMTELIDHINDGPQCWQCNRSLEDLAEDLVKEQESDE